MAGILSRGLSRIRGAIMGASKAAIGYMLRRHEEAKFQRELDDMIHAAKKQKPKGVTIVAGGPGYRASNGTVVSRFMAPMDFPHDRARLASSYRGARRNAAKVTRRQVFRDVLAHPALPQPQA
jgi:hypothetical protein